MPGQSCYFFADEGDLLDLLEAFGQLGDHKYVQIRSGLNEPNLIFTDPAQVLPLARVISENPTRAQSFLVIKMGQETFQREIALRDGSGIRKIADQNNNFDSIVLAFGGDAGDQTLIMSEINTVGDTHRALEMYKKFKKVVISKTKKIGVKGNPHRLMPGAIKMLKAGWRLASSKGWSRDTDANIPPDEVAAL
ncbi:MULTISPECIES: hypothetical protein [unclassified Microbulbifer]|uniref:hypothetical protein n=1 Tax=unclassified Microbulbifer TaxID=2619833 RepID=UPI0027E4CC7C|nr:MULTISPECIES: hypothetical protein [unclassified Microbulbifer]